MVILGIEVLVPGSEVQKQIGNPQQMEGSASKLESSKSEPLSHQSTCTSNNIFDQYFKNYSLLLRFFILLQTMDLQVL